MKKPVKKKVVSCAKERRPREPRGVLAYFDQLCSVAVQAFAPRVARAIGNAASQGHRDVAVVFALGNDPPPRPSEPVALTDISFVVVPLQDAIDYFREKATGHDKPLSEEAARARLSPGAVPAIFLYRRFSKTHTLLSPLAFTAGGSA